MSPDVIPFYETQTGTWSYLVADATNRVAAIIDPVWVYDPVSGRADDAFTGNILDEAEARGWKIVWVLETHAHADHLSSGDLVRKRTGAQLGIGRGIRDVQATFRKVYNLAHLAPDGAHFDRLLADGEELPLGEMTIRVMETPGHTADSVSYLVGDAAFVGDTLFAPNAGSARCDFPGGDAGRLYDTVQRLHALSPGMRLYLCHDYPAEGVAPRAMVTVAESRRDNIHLKDGTSREAYVRMRNERDATLGMPKLILPAIQVNVIGGSAPDPEANGVSYLKIPFNTSIRDILSPR